MRMDLPICLCEQDDDHLVVPAFIEEDLLTYAEIEAEIDGTVSFDWMYNTEDVGGAFLDVAFYLDGALIDIFGADEQSGSFSVEVSAGETIAMGIFSMDGHLGRSEPADIKLLRPERNGLHRSLRQLELDDL